MILNGLNISKMMFNSQQISKIMLNGSNINLSNLILFGCILYHDYTQSNANDLSGNGNDGTVYGAILSNQGASFDGINDYISVPNNYNPLNNAFSIVVVGNLQTLGTLISKLVLTGIPPASHNGFWLGRTSTFSIYSDSYGSYSQATGLVANENFSYIVTINPNDKILIYKNGVQISTKTIGNYNLNNLSNYNIGRYVFQSDSYIKGILKNIQLYNRILTSNEVILLHDDAVQKYGI